MSSTTRQHNRETCDLGWQCGHCWPDILAPNPIRKQPVAIKPHPASDPSALKSHTYVPSVTGVSTGLRAACHVCGNTRSHGLHFRPSSNDVSEALLALRASASTGSTKPWTTNTPLAQWTDRDVVEYSAFLIESVAHLRDMPDLLPLARRLRTIG